MSISPTERNNRTAAAQRTEFQQPVAGQAQPAETQKTEPATAGAQPTKDSFQSARLTEATATRSGDSVADRWAAIKGQRRSIDSTEDSKAPVIGGPTAPAGSSPFTLVNEGGAVLDKPVINNIYLGDYWNTAEGKTMAAHNDAFTKDIEQSPYMDVLKQYGVGKGSFAGSTVVPGPSPKRLAEPDIQNIVKKAIASGSQSSDPQAIHTVILPPGTLLVLGKDNSHKGLGGYHGSYQGPDGKPVYYAAICYSKGKNGIDFTGNPADNTSIIESHEWSEAATDPDVLSPIKGRKSAWDNPTYGEIGDEAIESLPLSTAYDKVDGYAVQKEWSNQDQAFEVKPKSGPNSA
jgi:hypothetical protein